VGFGALIYIASLAGCAPPSRVLREPTVGDGVEVSAQAADASALGIRVDRVIVQGGPGMWVKGANWDEYVVSVENTSDAPVRVVGLSLESEHLPAVAPSGDLALLEKQTNAQMRMLRSIGVTVGVGYVAGAVAFASAAGGGAEVGVIAGASAAAVLMPVALVATGVFIHHKHNRERMDRELIKAEITKRSIALPGELAAGETRSGSLFFPITPAPSRLVLRYATDSGEREVGVELTAIRGLHLKPPKGAPAK
jgi:hypothetical protein